jgi:hypothetical protein
VTMEKNQELMIVEACGGDWCAVVECDICAIVRRS